MVKNETKSLPNLASIDALIHFFDSNDLGEYLPELPAVEFEVELQKRTFIITLDLPLAQKLGDIAKARHIAPAMLVNRWVREKILEQPLLEPTAS